MPDPQECFVLSRLNLPLSHRGAAAWQASPSLSADCAEGVLDARGVALLSPAEAALWAGLSAYGGRREQWLLGRMAAKAAVQELVRTELDESVPLAELEVVATVSGAPTVVLPPPLRDVVRALVSISHTGSVGVALGTIDPRVRGVGVDVEEHRPRRSLERKGLTAAERAFLDRVEASQRLEVVLRLWSAKEAAAKALGAGLDLLGGAQRIRVTLLSEDASDLAVDVDAPVVGGARRLRAHTARVDDHVIATVVDGPSTAGEP